MIREFQKEDRDDIIRLGNLLGNCFDIAKLSENENLLIYQKGEMIVGFVDYIKLYEVIEILYIVVEGDSRREGIATDLLNYIFANYEHEKSILEVRIDNVGAIKFYESLGYKIVRTIKNYTQDAKDAYVMERSTK